MIVVLVAGSRTYNDRPSVFKELDRVHLERRIECILHGDCPNRKNKATGEIIWSADRLALEWARSREIPHFGVPAKWKTGTHGNGEGPIRNQIMADMNPHYAVLFPGGSGTSDMLEKVIKANIPHEVIK